jgi:hypothetical protein
MLAYIFYNYQMLRAQAGQTQQPDDFAFLEHLPEITFSANGKASLSEDAASGASADGGGAGGSGAGSKGAGSSGAGGSGAGSSGAGSSGAGSSGAAAVD